MVILFALFVTAATGVFERLDQKSPPLSVFHMSICTRKEGFFKAIPVLRMIKRNNCRSGFRAKLHVAVTEACKTIFMTALTLRIADCGKCVAFSTMFGMASRALESLLFCSPSHPQ